MEKVEIDLSFPIAVSLTRAVRAGAQNLQAQIATGLENPTPYTLMATYSPMVKKGEVSGVFGIKQNQADYLYPLFNSGGRDYRPFEQKLSDTKYAVPTPQNPYINSYGNVPRNILIDALSKAENSKDGYRINERGVYYKGVRYWTLTDTTPQYKRELSLKAAENAALEKFEEEYYKAVEKEMFG